MKKIRFISNQILWRESFLAYTRMNCHDFYFYANDQIKAEFDAVLINANDMNKAEIDRYIQAFDDLPVFLMSDTNCYSVHVNTGCFVIAFIIFFYG